MRRAERRRGWRRFLGWRRLGWRRLGWRRLFGATAFKLAIAYFVIVGLGFTLVIERVGENIRDLINDQTRQTIHAEIKGLADQYEVGGLTQLVTVVERRSRAPGASIYLVAAPNGVAVAGNVLQLPAGVLDQKTAVEIDYERLGEPNVERRAIARVFTLPGNFRLLIGHDLEDRERLRHILNSALFTSLLWLLGIATFGGLFVARRLLQRVDAMRAKAAIFLQGDLTGRLPLSGADDELDRLARNLNAMLDRIARLMEGIRQVSDNIAHDLRTPLTRLRNNAEQALQLETGEEGARAALEQVIEEADGLIRIFNALLMIARAESQASRENFGDLDAAELARDMAELYEPAAEEAGIVLRVEAPAPAPIHGQRELIGLALANLIDNALKYGAPEVPGESMEVSVTAEQVGDRIEIGVGDHGPGIPAPERERVLERFVRLETSRSRPGSGLGLSLAAAVAHLHDGVLRVEDNAPGLRVVMSLPRRSEKGVS
jgi:signal transduction histidine kinase